MIYICKPSKVRIYVNTAKKTIAQIKAETGCDAIINAGLFNLSAFTPVSHLKVDGKVLSSNQWRFYGYGWDADGFPTLTVDYSGLDNYVCCLCLVREGKAEKLSYTSDLGGSRQRTAMGTFADGRLWLYADKTGKTPEQLQTIALEAGVRDAVMLDGGGSTQGIFPDGTVESARKVHNLICVWSEEAKAAQMTEAQLRQKVVSIAAGYVGCNEKDGSFRKIIDLYNSHTPRARGYKLQYTDAWCSGFASAVAIEADLTDIIPTEVGCGKHIALFQALGSWVENDAYTPEPGDYIFYDWQDSGVGDNTGGADHVGVVETVSGDTITVIEGNMNEAVGRRTLKVNGKYIRGYGVPNYASKATETELVKVEEDKPEEDKPAEVKIDGAASGPNAAYNRIWTVNASLGLQLRTGASTKKTSLGLMPNGSKVRCYGYYTKTDGTVWLLVVVQSGKQKGKTGFCSMDYLK